MGFYYVVGNSTFFDDTSHGKRQRYGFDDRTFLRGWCGFGCREHVMRGHLRDKGAHGAPEIPVGKLCLEVSVHTAL